MDRGPSRTSARATDLKGGAVSWNNRFNGGEQPISIHDSTPRESSRNDSSRKASSRQNANKSTDLKEILNKSVRTSQDKSDLLRLCESSLDEPEPTIDRYKKQIENQQQPENGQSKPLGAPPRKERNGGQR